MTRRWQRMGAIAGVFVAVVGLIVVLLVVRYDSSSPSPATPGGGARASTVTTAPADVGSIVGGPAVIRLSSPPRVVQVNPSGLRIVTLRTTPVPGVCGEPAMPLGTTPGATSGGC